MMSKGVIDRLREEIGDALIEASDFRGDDAALVRRDSWLRAASFLRNSCGMGMMLDLCAVDYPERDERFEIVAHMRSPDTGRRVRLKTRCPEGDPSVGSLTAIWRCADWFEREAYDLFGIRFVAHPNLRRLLCHEGFEGHPLRKDYPKSRRCKIAVPRTLMDEMEEGQAEAEV